MFGISHNLDIEGPLVCGRYIRAKKLLQSSGRHTPLPHVFREGGGHRPAVGGKGKGKKGKVWGWSDERVHSVMGLVQMHEGEYQRWPHTWGRPSPGGNADWRRIWQPAVGGLGTDDPLVRHHQLQLSPMTSSPRRSDLQSARQMAIMSGSGSTIVRRSAGQPLAAVYEARNVFITNLPEVLLLHLDTHTAAEVYQKWLQCEVIIGKRPRRGHA